MVKINDPNVTYVIFVFVRHCLIERDLESGLRQTENGRPELRISQNRK